MIQLRQISKSYQKTKALVDFDAVFENKIYGLLGPNGSGKTTLFRIIAGLIRANKGTILFNQDHPRARIKVGYLPQRFGLIPQISVENHLLYFAELKKIKKSQLAKEVRRVLELVALEDKASVKCSALSGGMVRRIGIAQALLGQPHLILLDEATVGLDPEERMRFKLILNDLARSCPIVLATHIVEDVDAVCDQVIVLKEGKTLFNDSVEQLINWAQNKVCVLKYEKINQIFVDKQIIRLFTDSLSHQRMARVLLRERINPALKSQLEAHIQGIQFVNPTIEDGYISMTME